MSADQSAWQLDAGTVERLEAELRAAGYEWTDSVSTERAWLDTFDWRLWRAGRVLECDRAPEATRVRVRELGRWVRGTADRDREIEDVPQFVDDIPDSVLRDELGLIVESRELSIVASSRLDQRSFDARDDTGAVVARVVLEQHGDDGSLVVVVPIRGHRRAWRGAVELVDAVVGPGECPDPMEIAVAGLGRTPGDRGGRFRPELGASETAREAIGSIAAELVATVRANEPGAVVGVDIEYLHDLRVAVRRLRSVLGACRGVLTSKVRKSARGELKKVGDVTSRVRDLDVHLDEFDELQSALGPGGAGLDLLRVMLLEERAEAQRQFIEMTSGEWYARLLDELAHLSDRDDAWLPPAEGPVAELAAREIGRAAERLLRQGRSIDGDSPDDALHQLRKDGKRLRYLIESFAALLPDDDSDALVTRLKELQNHLGAYQDVCFEMRDLASFRQRLLDSDRVGGQTVAAMDGLIASLQRRREALRAEFEAVFARFDAPETRVSVDAVAGRS